MMKPHNGFALTLSIDLAEIDRVNAAFAAFADAQGFPGKLRSTMPVVLDELLSNAIKYGFRERDGGDITVHVDLADGRLAVTITDDGKPFDPFRLEDPDTTLTTQQRKIGGLGIYIVRNTMEEYSYERVGNRNVLRLVKAITDN